MAVCFGLQRLCALFIVALPAGLRAADWKDAREIFLRYRERPVEFAENVKRTTQPLTVRDILGLGDETDIKGTDAAATVQGTEVIRYQETFRGIPVFDATLTAEKDRVTHRFTGQATGRFVEGISEDVADTEPALTPEKAQRVAKTVTHLQGAGVRISEEEPKLTIYLHRGVAVLAYQVVFYAETGDKSYRPCVIVDAKSGEVLRQWSMHTTYHHVSGIGGNTKVGQYKYGFLLPFLEVAKKGDVCVMENSYVRVINLAGQEYLNNEKGFRFDCKNGAKDEVNGAYSPADDALYFGKLVYRMYYEYVKVPPVNRPPIVIRVHYGQDRIMAMYNGRNFTFGDGKDGWFPLVGLDVVAHEVSHCFTEMHSDLIYKGQSGGINEAFSDLAGEAAEYFERGTNDWTAGNDISKDPTRYLCNQSKDGMSIVHASQFAESLDVHYLSGVYNRAACLLAKAQDWSVKKVFQMFVHANRFYWHPETNFSEGACDVAKAAYDIGFELQPVVDAFDAVGIAVCDMSEHYRTIHVNSSVANLRAADGEEIVFRLPVSEKHRVLRIMTLHGEGDANLYVHPHKHRKLSRAKWKSTFEETDEIVVIRHPRVDTYYVVLRSGTGKQFKGVLLMVTASP